MQEQDDIIRRQQNEIQSLKKQLSVANAAKAHIKPISTKKKKQIFEEVNETELLSL